MGFIVLLRSSSATTNIHIHSQVDCFRICAYPTFASLTQPGEGYLKQDELNDKDDVKPQNDYTSLEKLELALAMAESLAVLHSYEGGLIVHDDVQLCQWLRTRDDRLVLGDFNRAEIMDWNEEKGEYCMYNNGYAYGNVSLFGNLE